MLKKLKTQTDINKIKKRNNIIVGVVMIGILTLSSLGFSLMSSNKNEEDSSVNELGVEFFKIDGLWKTIIGEEVFGFQNLPSEVSDVNVNISLDLEMYSRQPLYFINPNEGASEILNNIGRYVLRYQEACLNNESCVGNLPLKDCGNNLIIFVPQSGMIQMDSNGNKTEVYQNESCVYIIGNSIKGADAFLYKLLEVN